MAILGGVKSHTCHGAVPQKDRSILERWQCLRGQPSLGSWVLGCSAPGSSPEPPRAPRHPGERSAAGPSCQFRFPRRQAGAAKFNAINLELEA